MSAKAGGDWGGDDARHLFPSVMGGGMAMRRQGRQGVAAAMTITVPSPTRMAKGMCSRNAGRIQIPPARQGLRRGRMRS